MKPPTSVRPYPPTIVLLLLLLAMVVVGEASAGGHSRRGRYSHHHKALHEDQQQHVRAPRTRREQDSPTEVTTTGSGDGPPGTVAPLDFIPCKRNEDCVELVNSECNKKNVCSCPNHVSILAKEERRCLKKSELNNTCEFDIQCKHADEMSFCNEKRMCVCKEGYKFADLPNIGLNCASTRKRSSVNSAMIGVVAGLGLMFVIICVVLRLFSKARFRENRSIFNTPNPRLMNASLFKDSKLLSPARGERRGSRASVRAPSRAPSVTSVNAASRSPNGSLAKGGRRGSAMSAVSGTGSASGAPPAPQQQQQPTQTQTQPPPPTITKTESPSKDKTETTVAIETVD